MRLFQPWSWLAMLPLVLARDEIEPEVKSIPLKTHSLAVPYLDSKMQNRWFDFGGDTIIRTDQYIRLTGELPSRAGWIFSRVPLTATNWEVEVEFKIEGAGTLYGDGIGIWLTKQRATGGPVFGFMDKFEGLGIFIDTYKNDRPGVVFPYVMAMMGDGNTAYDKEHDGKANELGGCPYRNIRNNAHPTKIKITYLHDKMLTVQLSSEETGHWDHCFSMPNVKIPSVAYLGFSAETGELADSHDIISVEARNLYMPDSSSSGRGNAASPGGSSKKYKKHGSGGGWGWFLIKFLIFGCIVAGGYAGFTVYRAQKNKSRF